MADDTTMSPEGADAPPQAADARRRRTLIIVGIAVAVVAALLLAWALAPRGAGTPGAATSPTATAPGTGTTPSSTPDASETPAVTPSESSSPAPTADPGDPFPEQSPVAPTDPGSAAGISVKLTKFESVTGEVVGPGDVAAAAVRVTVDITNTGSEPLDLDLVVMNAYMGEQRDPAETYEKPGGQPVNGSLEPGKTATGVYLFRIPEDRRGDVTFVVDYHAGQPAITWRGQVP